MNNETVEETTVWMAQGEGSGKGMLREIPNSQEADLTKGVSEKGPGVGRPLSPMYERVSPALSPPVPLAQ